MTIAQLGLFDPDEAQVGNRGELYPTPAKLTAVLLNRYPHIAGHICEPCAGLGDISQTLNAAGLKVFTNDLDGRHPAHYTGDATSPAAQVWQRSYHWTVTNPPFTQAHKILSIAWQRSRIGVAFLLRLSYMEAAKDRAAWLVAHADHLVKMMTFNPRPSFNHSGNTDNVTAAWFIWRKDHSWRQLGISPPFEFITGWK